MADIQGACLCRGSLQHWKGRLVRQGFSCKGFRRPDIRGKSQDGSSRGQWAAILCKVRTSSWTVFVCIQLGGWQRQGTLRLRAQP